MTAVVFFVGGTWRGDAIEADEIVPTPATLYMREGPSMNRDRAYVTRLADALAERYVYVAGTSDWFVYRLEEQ